MKKIYFLILLAATWLWTINAQVGISTTTPQAMLEVNSSDQGVLFSRVRLTSRNIQLLVVNPQGDNLTEGTLVYKTATAGSAPFDVMPEFYFWDSTQWVALDGRGGRDWHYLVIQEQIHQ